jgi:hypothetical protein
MIDDTGIVDCCCILVEWLFTLGLGFGFYGNVEISQPQREAASRFLWCQGFLVFGILWYLLARAL